jgi:hypothetical protein
VRAAQVSGKTLGDYEMLESIRRAVRGARRFLTRPHPHDDPHEKTPLQLKDGELMVLRLIQKTWGAQNTLGEVFLMDQPGCEGAWIFVKDADGTSRGGVNLTNVSAWYEDGTYSYEDVLRAVRGPE